MTRIYFTSGTRLYAIDDVSSSGVGGSWWGGWFPETGPGPWWGFAGKAWFPSGALPTIVPSVPGTIAALLLESGSTMTIRWSTGFSVPLGGKESRSNLMADPVLEFAGTALISRGTVQVNRARLAQFAALGLPFSLGMPWEGITVDDEATGNAVNVPSTANIDWMAIGVRVIVNHPENGMVESYITAFDATSITLADAVGDVGDLGADIMPVIQVLLDPEQPFDRYTGEDDVERWSIKATAVVPGILSGAAYATLPLLGNALSGAADGVTLIAPTIGPGGNALQVQFVGDAGSFAYAEVVSSTLLVYHFVPDDTTVASMMGSIERTDFLVVSGTRPSDVLTSADEFGPTNLSGGQDQAPVEMGQGATITMFGPLPVWDRPINATSTAKDSIQTRAPIVELGGGRFAAWSGSKADWGRQISLKAELAEQWQWVKKFIWYVKGSWRTFWLPTWRHDLTWLATGTGTITVDSSSAAGDFFTWYPVLRTRIQILQDTVVTYARISAAVDNGDGTITLTLYDEDDNPITISGEDVDAISWLELTRFNSDDTAPTFTGAKFALTTSGRVVQQ